MVPVCSKSSPQQFISSMRTRVLRTSSSVWLLQWVGRKSCKLELRHNHMDVETTNYDNLKKLRNQRMNEFWVRTRRTADNNQKNWCLWVGVWHIQTELQVFNGGRTTFRPKVEWQTRVIIDLERVLKRFPNNWSSVFYNELNTFKTVVSCPRGGLPSTDCSEKPPKTPRAPSQSLQLWETSPWQQSEDWTSTDCFERCPGESLCL